MPLDLKTEATRAGRALQAEAGDVCVGQAAREAVHGEQATPPPAAKEPYARAVDAFWKLRCREGIPAVRTVLGNLGVQNVGI